MYRWLSFLFSLACNRRTFHTVIKCGPQEILIWFYIWWLRRYFKAVACGCISVRWSINPPARKLWRISPVSVSVWEQNQLIGSLDNIKSQQAIQRGRISDACCCLQTVGGSSEAGRGHHTKGELLTSRGSIPPRLFFARPRMRKSHSSVEEYLLGLQNVPGSDPRAP